MRLGVATVVVASVGAYARTGHTEPPTPAVVPSATPAPAEYETTVTALRLPRPLPDVPSTVTVLVRDEIDRTPALTADDLVRAVPSAATFRRTPSLVADPTAQGVNLRGVAPSGVSRALVLVDGLPANDPFGGWVYWRALPRLGLDRIEVVPGGTSALYGNFALGGVVHLMSRTIENRVEADVAAGALGTRTLGLAAAGRSGPVGGAIEAEAFGSDGYVPVISERQGTVDGAAESWHGAASGRVEAALSGEKRVGAHVRVFKEHQNGGTPLTTAAVQTVNFGVSFDAHSDRRGSLALAAFGGVGRFDQQRARIAMDRSTEEVAARQEVPHHSQGAFALWTSPVVSAGGSHVVVAGADIRRVTGAADETLFPAMVGPMSVVGRRSHGEQQFAGIFVEELYDPLPWLALSAAGRMDLWRNVGAERTIERGDATTQTTPFPDRNAVELSPRVGALVKLGPWTRVRASGYRAFRAPTLNELYRPFQVGAVLTAANEDLRAERLLGGEIGVERLFGPWGAVRLAGFANLLSDPIVNVTLPMPIAGAARQRQNLGRARIHGIDASADARLGRKFFATAAYTLADSRVLEARAQPELEGKRLPQDPVHRARLALAFVHPRWVSATVQFRALGDQFEDDLNDLPMDGFVVLDAFAAVPVARGVQLFASAQNLLGRRYLVGRATTGIDTLGPPLVFMGGIRYR